MNGHNSALPVRGLSTLIGVTVRMVAFGHSDHPVWPREKFLAATVYRAADACYVLCISEGSKPYNVQASRDGLGLDVPGELIAVYAQRYIEGISLVDLKTCLAEGFHGMAFEWEK